MARSVFLALLASMSLSACGGSAECGPAECADVCAAAAPAVDPAPKVPSIEVTDFERSLVDPLLDDMRQGVRPFDASSIGICKGSTRVCAEFVGAEAGELPPGEYSVHAHLTVPNVGPKGTWKVLFESTCETTKVKKDGTEAVSKSTSKPKEYEVIWAAEGKAFSLAPLRRIESPSKNGKQSCTFKVIAPHPDGDKVYEGSWSVPAVEG